MHAILQHCFSKAALFYYKTLLVQDSSIGSSESLSDRASLFKIEFKMSFDWSWYSCLSKISVDLSWKDLVTEAKTQFGVQKGNVRVCRIPESEVNKARYAYRKIQVNSSFWKIRVNLV